MTRNADTRRSWQRPLDLPCEDLLVRVVAENPEEIACNLPRAESATTTGDDGASPKEAIFHSDGKPLPADFTLRVDLAHLPVAWITQARWIALAALGCLAAVAGVVFLRRRKTPAAATNAASDAVPRPKHRRKKDVRYRKETLTRSPSGRG